MSRDRMFSAFCQKPNKPEVSREKRKKEAKAWTYRLNSSWLLAKACANRSRRMERAVNGDAPPPELDSPPDTDRPCMSSRLMSADICASCSCWRRRRWRKSINKLLEIRAAIHANKKYIRWAAFKKLNSNQFWHTNRRSLLSNETQLFAL